MGSSGDSGQPAATSHTTFTPMAAFLTTITPASAVLTAAAVTNPTTTATSSNPSSSTVITATTTNASHTTGFAHIPPAPVGMGDLASVTAISTTISAGQVVGTGDNGFGRTFSSFFNRNPATSGRIELGMGGSTCTGGELADGFSTDTSQSFSTTADRAAAVYLVLRTGTIYHDRCTVSAQYYVRSASGRPQVLRSGLGVSMTVSHDTSAASVSVSCGTADASTGAATCSYTGSEHLGWFDTSQAEAATVTISVRYDSAEVASSTPASITLAPLVEHGALERAGMVVTMPYSPRFQQDTFSSVVSAHTGGYALSTFGFVVMYDSEVLEYNSVEGDSKYLAPTVNDYTTGQVVVITSGLASGVTDAEVTGSNVRLAELSFTVQGATSGGLHTTHSSALTCTVSEMVSTSTITIDGTVNVAAQIDDEQGGAVTEGQLTVQKREVVGIYAYVGNAELFNTACLSGVNVSTAVTVQRVYNQAGASDGTVVDAMCSVNESWARVVAVHESCEVHAAAGHTEGGSGIIIGVEAEEDGATHSTAVEMSVWFPQDVKVEAADHELGHIGSSSSGNGTCDQRLFQGTQLYAEASFGGIGMNATRDLDVTALMTFAADDPSVVEVDGCSVRGMRTGSAVVHGMSGDGATQLAFASGASISVVDAEVLVTRLSAVLVTGAVFEELESPVALDMAAEVQGNVTLLQELQSEGASGVIFVYAAFEDGTWQELKRADNVTVEVQPEYASSLTVVETTSGNADFQGLVPSGGESAVSHDVLLPTWRHPCSGEVIAIGTGTVNVSLAEPVSVVVSSKYTRMTREEDAASASPISLPTSSALTVEVTYDDGTTKDFTADGRTEYAVTTGAGLVQVVDATAGAISEATGFGLVTIVVTFPTYSAASGMNASVDLQVVGLDHVTIRSSPYPSYSGSSSTDKTTLSLLLCTAVFQRAVLKLTAVLTDSQTADVTSSSRFASSNATALMISDTTMIPAVAGAYNVSGAFEGHDSANLLITVSGGAVMASSITHSTSWGSGDTFGGVVNTTKTLGIKMVFGDGTMFTDLVSGTQSSWVGASELAVFASDAPDRVGVSTGGVAELRLNHYAAVSITASAACSVEGMEAVSSSDEVYANLQAAAYDVDLGSPSGLQLEATAAGSELNVPVWIETGSGTLQLFDILLQFDAAHLEAVACAVGDEWSQYSFTCTINDPPEEVLLTGVEISTDVQGLVQVATVTFLVKGTFDVTPLEGVVQGLQCSNYESSEEVSIVAGRGELVQLDGRRRHVLQAAALSPPPRWRQRPWVRSRRLQQTGRMLGDVNGDGVFDVFDTQDAKKWAAGVPGYTMEEVSELSAFQRQQLDPTLDYLTDPNVTSNCPAGWDVGTPCPSPKDTQYLQYVYANFLRFVALATADDVASMLSVPEDPEGTLAINVTVYDKTGEMVTGNTTMVKYELEVTGVNQEMQLSGDRQCSQ
ncbi:hypothetical protein CYMTET_6793 [Cymbomonas tetramitiformis]|uniref:Uncharacterized protein n=1 Tax=Cymbomonas tetramitiformis TaxID=36881 RepID=A0AAE0LHJ4_9CHLO|nr:hypothetical protein CYMTET_6793 [Cymbomonas tetramitiformis]